MSRRDDYHAPSRQRHNNSDESWTSVESEGGISLFEHTVVEMAKAYLSDPDVGWGEPDLKHCARISILAASVIWDELDAWVERAWADREAARKSEAQS